jgi:hypothetical protein
VKISLACANRKLKVEDKKNITKRITVLRKIK